MCWFTTTSRLQTQIHFTSEQLSETKIMILRSNGWAFDQVSSLRVARFGLDLAAVRSFRAGKQTSHVILAGIGGSEPL